MEIEQSYSYSGVSQVKHFLHTYIELQDQHSVNGKQSQVQQLL